VSDHYEVRPEGELDIVTTVEMLQLWLSAVEKHQPARFVINLSAVTFLDCTALSAIAQVYRRQRQRGGTVTVTNAPQRVARILQLTRLDETIEVNGAKRPSWPVPRPRLPLTEEGRDVHPPSPGCGRP
jgi:anti-anti-sigma factor